MGNEKAEMPQKASSSSMQTPKYAWVILCVTFFVSVVIPMQWFSVPPNAGVIFGMYGISHSQFGMLMSGISITAMIMAFPASWFVRRLGLKTTILSSVALMVIGGVVGAIANAFTPLFIGRVIQGLGVGLCAVSAPTCISVWFSNKARGLAMAIWSTWVPVGMLIVFNVSPLVTAAYGLKTTWWALVVFLVLAFVLFAILYRDPKAEEATEVSSERVPFKKVLPLLKSRQFIALIVAWLAFNYVNYAFTTYNVTFFQTDLGMDATTAAMIGSIASASGILAPIFGAVQDKLPKNRKYLVVFLGAIGLLLTACLGFKAGAAWIFIAYMVFQIVGNPMLVGTCRPMVPLLLGSGGATAVALGLSFITFFQFLGQTFVSFFGWGVDTYGYATSSWFLLVPVAVVAVIFAFLVKPSKKNQ